MSCSHLHGKASDSLRWFETQFLRMLHCDCRKLLYAGPDYSGYEENLLDGSAEFVVDCET